MKLPIQARIDQLATYFKTTTFADFIAQERADNDGTSFYADTEKPEIELAEEFLIDLSELANDEDYQQLLGEAIDNYTHERIPALAEPIAATLERLAAFLNQHGLSPAAIGALHLQDNQMHQINLHLYRVGTTPDPSGYHLQGELLNPTAPLLVLDRLTLLTHEEAIWDNDIQLDNDFSYITMVSEWGRLLLFRQLGDALATAFSGNSELATLVDIPRYGSEFQDRVYRLP
ncbi:MAG: hypothetical protein KDC54_02390 [Lewinella sp.]|nr:hypothetical protein [Lewinella sp.]